MKRLDKRWAEVVSKSRELTDVDAQAVKKLDKAAKKAANRASNLDIGQHLDKSDLLSAAREALVMTVVQTEPDVVSAFVGGDNRTFFYYVQGAISNRLKNYKKETLGAAQGMTRSQVDKALDEGTFKTPLSLDEALVGEEGAVETEAEGIEAPAKVTTPANVGVEGVTKEDMAPGPVKKIDVKTGEVVDVWVQKAQEAIRKKELERAAEATKQKVVGTPPKKGLAVAAIKDDTLYIGKPGEAHFNLAMDYAPDGKFQQEGFVGPEGKFLTREEALKKTKVKPTPKKKQLKSEDLVKPIKKYDTPEAIMYGEKMHGSVSGIRSLDHAREVLAKKRDEGNLDAKLFQIKNRTYVVGYGVGKVKAPSKPKPKVIKPTVSKVPSPGSIFTQIETFQKKVEKAAEEEITDLFGEKVKIKVEDEQRLIQELDSHGPIGQQALKGAKELIGNEDGSASVLNHVFQAFQRSGEAWTKRFQTFYDAIDVEAKWKRIDASNTGMRIKNMYGKIDSVEKRELKKLTALSKLIASIDTKMTQDQLADALLAAEDPALMLKLDEKLKPVSQWIRDYFDDSLKEYENVNIDISFKERKMQELMEKYMETTDYDQFKQAMRHMARLEKIEFVHIPLAVWKNSMAKQTLDPEFRRKFDKKIKSLELLAARKRRALSIADMLKHNIIKKDQIEVFPLLGNYMRNKAHDFAIADIRDAALGDGLLKVRKTKPAKDMKGNWIKVPPKYKGLGFYKDPTGKGGKIWIHDSVVNVIADAMESIRTRGKVKKFLAITKLMQFFNFLFLPMYDVWQHLMAGAYGTFLNPIGGAELFGKSFKQVFTKSEEYLEANEWGMSSKPFGLTFDQFMNAVDVSSKHSKGGQVGSILVNWGARALGGWHRQEGKLLPRAKYFPVLGAAYQTSFKMAWQLDEVVRMMTYNHLRDKGYSPRDAAQLSAKFHGDYASVPLKTRQMLNLGLFTPTFKIAMMKTLASMTSNFAKRVIPHKGFVKDWTTQSIDQRLAFGLIATGALLLAHTVVMSMIGGFEEEEFARRYKKKIKVDGREREMVVTISNPPNVSLRLYHKIAAMWNPKSTNIFETFTRNWVSELHPMWRLLYSLNANTKVDGDPIFNSMDDWDTKTIKTVDYMAESLIAAWRLVKETLNDKSPEETKAIKREFNKAFDDFLGGKIANFFTFSYTRNPTQYRKAMKIKSMRNQMHREMKQARRKGKDFDHETWVRNFRQRTKEMLRGK